MPKLKINGIEVVNYTDPENRSPRGQFALFAEPGARFRKLAVRVPGAPATPTPGHALDFDGQASYVATPLVLDGSHPFTLEAFVRARYSQHPISGTVVSDANNFGVALNVGKSKWQLRAGMGGSSATPSVVVSSLGVLQADRLQHLAGVYDGAEFRLYVDGVLQQKLPGQFQPSNQRLVIGGVTTNLDQDETRKIPLFGDIPVIGWLFKQTASQTTGRELVVFITPSVLRVETAQATPTR